MNTRPHSQAESCRQVAEILPWFLNGTLSAEESKQVADELASCEDCRARLAELKEVAGLMTAHLPTMTLAEYALGLPTDIPTSEIEAHLEICPQCRQELALIQMDTAIEDDFTDEADSADFGHVNSTVVDFNTARRRLTDSKPADQRRWARLAVAAGVTAALGGTLVFNEMNRPEIDSLVEVHETLPAGPSKPAEAEELLFSDGFESGDLGHWKAVIEES